MRRASYILLFLSVVFLGDRAIAFIARKVVQHSRNQFVRMYEGKYPATVLLLGNSRVDRNISVEKVQNLTGQVCLNLGLGGNHMRISEALLKDFIQRYGNPKVAVIELSHSIVKPNSMGEMRIFGYCSTNMQVLAKSVDPTYSAFESVFHSLRYNSPAFWRLSTEAFSEPSSRLLNNTIPPEISNQWKDGRQVEFPIFEENMQALGRICGYADARKVEIKLVISPYWKEFRKGISNFDSWKAAMQKAAGRHPIYDYSEAFFEHSDYFNDEMHLNAAGADSFAQKLVEDGVVSSKETLLVKKPTAD